MKKYLVLLAGTLFFSACESFPVYEEFATSKKTFECIRYDINDTLLAKSIYADLKFKNRQDCPYVLRGYIHNSDKCTSLYAKTHGVDFNGYVYLEIKKDKNRLYRVQSDYKDDLQGSISRVVTKVNTLAD